jgi:hypothetical protein
MKRQAFNPQGSGFSPLIIIPVQSPSPSIGPEIITNTNGGKMGNPGLLSFHYSHEAQDLS